MVEQRADLFLGVDVSKKQLDGYLHPVGSRFAVENSGEAIEQLVQELAQQPLKLIVVEATGGLETLLVTALGRAGLPVVVINPRQVRAFAKAIGRSAKTDRIDAEVLARFGEGVKPEVRPLKDEETRELAALQARRHQMVEMLAQEKNREARASGRVKGNISRHIVWLEQQIRDIEKEMTTIIRSSPLWRERDQVLRSVPGVGKVLSFSLLADLPELGSLGRSRISTLVGVAPLNRDSGVLKGTRRIWGGRAKVRQVLYMGTIAAIRLNPVIKRFYERLKQVGKKPKVAIVACMHKLLIILNTMIKDGTPWREREIATA